MTTDASEMGGRRYDDEELLAALQGVAAAVGHPPTVGDYRSHRRADDPSDQAIQRRYARAERPWFTALGMAGLGPNPGDHGGLGTSDMAFIVGLRMIANRQREWPSPDEYRRAGGSPSVQSIYQRFGSWNAAEVWAGERSLKGRSAWEKYPYLMREHWLETIRWAAEIAGETPLTTRVFNDIAKSIPDKFGWSRSGNISYGGGFESWDEALSEAGVSKR